jgi:hypothetical protein
MDFVAKHYTKTKAATSLSSPWRLLIFAVLVPAFVAGTNQWIYNAVPSVRWLEPWLYPWMIFTTAVLSWCSGRYLPRALLRWVVFGWSLVLLDLLTLAATQDGRIPDQFGYLLVSSQISLLVLWAVLGPISWQWRLPVALVAAPLVIGLTGAVSDRWWGQAWNMTLIFAAAAIVLLCVWLRGRGFKLARQQRSAPENKPVSAFAENQFGIKHMLVWAAAVVPLLLLMRGGIDFFVFSGVQDLETAFAAVAVGASLATVNLIAIWAVLGNGLIFARIALLLIIGPLLAAGLTYYSMYIGAKYGPSWPNVPILDAVYSMQDHWFAWLPLNAALLAALLLFLRAAGYRLVRNSDRANTSS